MMQDDDGGLVEREALRLWREREMQFPERVRRMKPDHFDRVSGAWAAMLALSASPKQG